MQARRARRGRYAGRLAGALHHEPAAQRLCWLGLRLGGASRRSRRRRRGQVPRRRPLAALDVGGHAGAGTDEAVNGSAGWRAG